MGSASSTPRSVVLVLGLIANFSRRPHRHNNAQTRTAITTGLLGGGVSLASGEAEKEKEQTTTKWKEQSSTHTHTHTHTHIHAHTHTHTPVAEDVRLFALLLRHCLGSSRVCVHNSVPRHHNNATIAFFEKKKSTGRFEGKPKRMRGGEFCKLEQVCAGACDEP